jgi:hypothetical protein
MRRVLAWTKTHRILAGIIAFIAVSIVVGAINSGSDKTATTAAAGTPSTPATSAQPRSAQATSAAPMPTPTATMVESSPASPATHAAPATKQAAAPSIPSPSASPSCDLPDNRDIIVRYQVPGMADAAQELGEADLATCVSTLDDIRNTADMEAGACTWASYADQNPGYDVNADAAPPLKNVLFAVGPAC